MPRIGILGGTFNPPHIGHLVCAQEALAGLDLHSVVLMPVGAPPHKSIQDDPGGEVRLELCRLAVEKDRRLAVSAVEVRRDGPSYTVDTLQQLNERHPGDDLTFIVGGDMAAGLPDWRAPEQVLALAELGVADRGGSDRAQIGRRLAPLRATERVRFFDMPRIDVSSSAIRARVAAGRPIRYLVPDEVAAHIDSRGLYRPAASTS